MKVTDFQNAAIEERRNYIVRPDDEIPETLLVEGSLSHLVFGQKVLLSFITMKAGTIFQMHSHAEEQIMIVLEGYCDEVIGDKIFRVQKGDVIHLPSNVSHGAFIWDVDCKAIDVFSPPRKDYAQKYQDQNPNAPVIYK